jgi:crotonobetaine/carnitine-CoA ligase
MSRFDLENPIQGPRMPAPTAQMPEILHPFVGQDVPWLLRARAAATPDRTFLIFAPFDQPAERWSYRAFELAARSVAAGLAARGVKQGDHVVLHMDNCIEFLLTWHGCAILGAIVVTTNTQSTADELAYYIAHCGATAVVTQPRFEVLIGKAAPHMALVIVTARDSGSDPVSARSATAVPFEAVAAASPEDAPARDCDPMLPNSVQYTSGTTSRPKGVVWTHANAIWGARQNAANCDLTSSDVGHTCLPLYHTNALCYSHLGTLWAGSCLVIQPRFSARRYWPCVIEHHCTFGIQIPFMLKALMALPVPRDHCFTRWGLGALNPPVLEPIFGIPCIGWFGMTETVAMPIVSMHGLPGRPLTMGVPVPEYGIKVTREDNSLVAYGESGGLWIKGTAGLSMFLEYLNDEAATAAAFDPDGWFCTGDRVTPFADGHIQFDGRERDMLRIGAENVAEAEIERVIMGVPGVGEVAVVGRPDEMLDEVPVAFVVPLHPDPTLPDRIASACLKMLAKFKRPREIFIVPDLPRVTLGKINKKELRNSLSGSGTANPPTDGDGV